jgi:DNA-binding NarL/FixJ family response regulator
MYNLDNIKTTEQEVEILELLSNGLRAFDIAERLNLAEQTIKNKVQVICIKLDSSNRTQAVARAIRLGII